MARRRSTAMNQKIVSHVIRSVVERRPCLLGRRSRAKRATEPSCVEEAGVHRLDVSRPGTITPIYENREHGPIYLYYAPTGREIAALIAEPGALGLAVLGVSDGSLRALGLGFPYYFSWRSDGDAIVTHTGGAPRAGH